MSIPDPIVLLDARAKYVHPAFQMSRASTKTVFDSAGRLVTVPANALGWDHDPVTGRARGYLAEPSATNLLLHSNDLTQAAWGASNASITANAITGPDGNGMAKLVENDNNSTHLLLQSDITISDGSTVVSSFIAKAAERSAIRSWVMNASSISNNAHCSFDLTNGDVRNENTQGDGEFVDAGITDLGDGFYRCWIAGRVGSGVTTARVEYRLLQDADSSNSAYQGDGTSGLYIGYCQTEEGSRPTSYIDTGGATATRAGDSLILSGLADFPWWRSERGTLLVDVDLPTQPVGGTLVAVGTEIMVSRASTGRIFLQGALPVSGSNNTIIAGQYTPGRHLVAVNWSDDETVGAGDGAVPVLLTLSSAISSTDLGIGARGNGTGPLLGHINRAVYYPARLSNADLQSLTAIQE